jgi:hypothetical protein
MRFEEGAIKTNFNEGAIKTNFNEGAINTNFKGTDVEELGRQNGIQWRALMSTVMHYRVP